MKPLKLQKIKLKLESHSSYEKYNRVIQVRLYSKTNSNVVGCFRLVLKVFVLFLCCSNARVFDKESKH